jgi:sugar phosphate isomerase/epimerase
MLFGMPVWYGDIRKGDYEPPFAKAKELGFDYIEFSVDHPVLRIIDGVRIAQIKELQERYGIGMAFHCPWNQQLADPRPEIREGSLKYIERCVDFSRNFSPLYVCFHMYASMGSWGAFPELRDDVISSAIEAAGKISGMGDTHSIPVLIENDPRARIGTIREIGLILDKNPGLKLCLDLPHVLLNNWALEQCGRDPEKSEISDWFSKFSQRINAVHINDVAIQDGGGLQEHLPLGKGVLGKDMPGICSLIDKSACEHIVPEVFFSDAKRTPVSAGELKASLDTVKQLIRK